MNRISGAVVAAMIGGTFALGCASEVDSTRLTGEDESAPVGGVIESEVPGADVSGLPEASDEIRQTLLDPGAGTCGRLNPGKTLASGQTLKSCGKAGSQFLLAMQGDGNLVVYGLDSRPLWNTGTWNNPGAKLIMQGDGNLVIYSTAGKAIWSAGSAIAGSLLELDSFGALTIWYREALPRNGIALNTRTQSRMALKTANGRYVSAQGGGGGAVLANAGAVGAWETFLATNEGGSFSLRTVNGSYISALGAGGGGLSAAPRAIGSWELFTMPQPFGDSRIAVRTVNGHYFSAGACGQGGNGTVNAAATVTWFCEAFTWVNVN